jgi:hypothetical protein
MAQLTFVSACTAVLTIAGCWIGFAVHDLTAAAIIPALAGAAGGFGIGCAMIDIARRWRECRH